MYFVYTTFAFLYIISAYNYTYSERTPTMPRTVYIGENLERLRLRAALSQIELAKKAGVTPAAVNRIERNRVEATDENRPQACKSLRRRTAYAHRRTLVRTEKVRWVHILTKQPGLEGRPQALGACGKEGGGGKKINPRPSFMHLSPPNLRECL